MKQKTVSPDMLEFCLHGSISPQIDDIQLKDIPVTEQSASGTKRTEARKILHMAPVSTMLIGQ